MLFWRIQLIAWLLFGLVYYLAVVPLAGRDPLRLLVFKLFWALTGVAVSSLLALLLTRAGLARRDPATALGLACFGSRRSGTEIAWARRPTGASTWDSWWQTRE